MTLITEVRSACDLWSLEREWDALAEVVGSPHLSAAWLASWAATRSGRAEVLLLRDGSGRLRSGACVRRLLDGVGSAADVETGVWGVVADGVDASAAAWAALAEHGGHRVRLDALETGPGGADGAARALQAAGFLVTVRPGLAGPRLVLPAEPGQVLAGVSHGLRNQYRRKLRALSRQGEVRLRTATAESAEVDLELFLDLEASGWKGRQGTAIRCRPSTLALYREFAGAAARRGYLRLQVLEVSGRAVAADLSCAFGGGVHMLKTGFDETCAESSPGLVLRGLALEAAVADGYRSYDLLGAAEPYKLRWGGAPRPTASVRAYRGAGSRLRHGYWRTARPVLKRVVRGAAGAPAGLPDRAQRAVRAWSAQR